MRRLFSIKPTAHLLKLGQAPLNAPYPGMQWPTQNVDISAERIVRRWDHMVDLVMGEDEVIQQVPIFRNYSGTNTVLILTETDLCKRETATGKTYSYLTPVYTGNTIASISGKTVVGSATWEGHGIEPGDRFILNEDYTADEEPNLAWATIDTVSGTTITLTENYTGTTGTFGVAKASTVRLVYSVPTGERWAWAVVAGKFCFSNGNVNVQVWTGTGKATDLDSTNAKQARCLVSYDDRLWMADHLVSGQRNPWMLSWSEIGDPTDWTDSTAGYKEFVDTEEPITGLGVAGGMFVVYKKTMYHIGRRTGIAPAPIAFQQDRRGRGLYAPNALLHAEGTNYFMGIDDFYRLNGDVAQSIGVDVRKKFFELSTDTELKKVFGLVNIRFNQVAWAITDTDGTQWLFVFNYKENDGQGTWTVYTFDKKITGFGGFAF